MEAVGNFIKSFTYGFINVIVEGVFLLISILANALLTPILTLFYRIFPDLEVLVDHIIVYFGKILSFVPHAIDMLMIPRTAIIFYLDFIIIFTTVQISIKGFWFLYNSYRKLKL